MALTKVSGDFLDAGSITQAHLHTSHGITTTHIAEGNKLFFTNARVDSRVGSLSTSDLSEGANLYYTDARARAAISGTGSLSYNSTTGVMSFTMPAQNTSNITEGSNLYYTDARADARIAAADTGDLSEGTNLYYTQARFNTAFTAKSTSDLSEGTNLYYTDARADARVALIVDSAPGTLNTLNELAAALGDDANFSTTVTNSIATKLPLAGGTLTGNLTVNARGFFNGGGAYPLQTSSTQRYNFQIRNTNNTVNSGYGWWLATDTDFDFALHADGAGDRFTLTRTGNATFTGTITASGYNNSNWDTAYGWGDHASGGYAADNAVVKLTGNQSISGTKKFSNSSLVIEGTHGTISFMDTTSAEDNFYIHVNSNNFYVLADRDGSNTIDGGYETPHPLQLEGDTNTAYVFGSALNISSWNTAYGWGDHGAAGYLTSLPSHTHDDRYYTESEMQSFFNRGYINNHSATNAAAGWYTIATNTGDRALGEFQIWDTASSDHQSVLFSASHHFGMDTSNDITVLANSRYSGTNFRYIRIKEGGTYDGAVLQVYIDGSSNTVYAAITGGNAQESGWVLKDWIADGTDPGDVSSYSSMTERTKVDLDLTQNGGIITTGPIYSGSQTTQYRVLNTSDEGSGNGLDADLLDGQHASAFQAAGSYAPAGGSYGTDWYANALYHDDWVRNHTNNSGHYWSSTGWHLYPRDADDFYMRSGSGSCALVMTIGNETARGYVYANSSSQIGFLNNARSWSLKVDNSGNTFATTSHRAPIFYDSNNTSYFLNPSASGGNALKTIGDWRQTTDSWSGEVGGKMQYHGNHWYIQAGGYIHFRNASGTNTFYVDQNGVGYVEEYIAGGASMRAPLFYDSANTNYYVDPAGTSRLYHAETTNGSEFIHCKHSGSDFASGTLVTTDIPANTTNGASYVIEVTGKSYSGEPPFAFKAQGYLYNNTIINHSGVSYGKHLTSTNQIKVFNHSDNKLAFWWPRISYWNSFEVRVRDAGGSGRNRALTVVNSTEPSSSKKVTTTLSQAALLGHNYGSGSLYSDRLYDQNDTTYYLDPASNGSKIKNLVIVPQSQSWSEGIRFDMPSQAVWGGLRWSRSGASGNAANWAIGFAGNESTDDMTWWSGTGNHRWRLNHSGDVTVQGSSRAPVFYDSNDTSYYVNPAGLSDFYSIKTTSSVDIAPRWDTSFYVAQSQHYYGHTSTQTMYLGEANHINIRNIADIHGQARAPIYYDRNNTGYYMHPDSTSVIVGLTMAGALQTAGSHTVGSSGTSNIYMGGTSGNHFRFHTTSGSTYFDMNSGNINWRNGSSTRFIFYNTTANMTVYGTITQHSDLTIKDNIVEIPNCINKVKSIRGIYYNRTDFNTQPTKIGVIAQEVEVEMPELVHNEEISGIKSVSYTELTAVLVNAIKEQQTIIDDLKTRLETLENQ